MDIHQSGTPADRLLYAQVWNNAQAWRELDDRHRFDYILLPRTAFPGHTLLDRLDADSTWALVFADDPAALYVRRGGAHDSLARRYAYRYVPAGTARLRELGPLLSSDSLASGMMRTELDRLMHESEWNARARSLLVDLLLGDRDYAGAIEQLHAILRIAPDFAVWRARLQLAQDSLKATTRP